jgi:hypothetical protein
MRSGRDEPIWVIIHICMESTQRISLYSCLYLKTSKSAMFFLLSFIFFFFNKIREEEEQALPRGRRRGEGR